MGPGQPELGEEPARGRWEAGGGCEVPSNSTVLCCWEMGLPMEQAAGTERHIGY